MKKFLVTLLIGAFIFTVRAGIDIAVTQDRPAAIYKIGEEIVFNIKATNAGQAVPAEQLECFAYGVDGKRTACALTSGNTQVKFKATAPGFIQLIVRAKNSKKDDVICGVAIEPDKITQKSTEPADFDAFWAKQLKKVRGVPFKVKVDDVSSDRVLFPGKIVCKEVTITSDSGIVATGFLAYPAGAKDKSLPIYVSFNGAGIVVSNYKLVQDRAKFPALVFNLNFHGLNNQIDDQARRARRKKLMGYQYKNADDLEKYAMRDIFLRVILSLDYMKTHKLWDGKRLIVHGGSMGGCQALVAAALDKDVTICVAPAAAMCNHTGTPDGWPLLLENVPTAASLAPYFDVVNFAKRIKCQVVMTVGFIDRICFPGSTYVAYNNISGNKKKMYHVVLGGHDGRSPDNRGVYDYGIDEIEALRNPKTEKKIK